jgi:CMP-N,N'-diacetyllegionaminic acid synthase
MVNILAIIPARSGSKGLPGKNTLRLGKLNMIELAVASALESRLVTRTVFSSESEEYCSIARAAGAEVPFLRPNDLAGDTSSTWGVMRHAVNWIESREGWTIDVLVILQPTTPFRRGFHIDETIQLMLSSDASSSMTVREADYPPEWMLTMDQHRNLKRLMPDVPRPSRRQDSQPAFRPNGLVYALRRANLDLDLPIPAADTKGFEMAFEDSVNVDTKWDWELARALWTEKGAAIESAFGA